MAEKVSKELPVFESLIFPIKRKWIVQKPVRRARKSLVKRAFVSYNVGAGLDKTKRTDHESV